LKTSISTFVRYVAFVAMLLGFCGKVYSQARLTVLGNLINLNKKLGMRRLFLSALFCPLLLGIAQAADTITVFGSSVAGGAVADVGHGYGDLFSNTVSSLGWVVVNKSIGGNKTKNLLGRFNADLVPTRPKAAIIGLSLANEGILGRNPARIYQQYVTNMQTLIARCRQNDIIPVIALCYPNDGYTAAQYQYIKDMNILINSWNVASINFLGAIDDGKGHWAASGKHNAGHPNNLGHEQLYYSMVPTLYSALMANKPRPQFAETSDALLVDSGIADPVTYTPKYRINSFAMCFQFKTASSGVIAAIEQKNKSATVEVAGSKLVYTGMDGQQIQTTLGATSNGWHNVIVSHRYLPKQVLLFVDGVFIDTISEQITPDRFVLGGFGKNIKASAPVSAQYREWLVYRAALNSDEAGVLAKDNILLQASLEICAHFAPDSLDCNSAQSLSVFEINKPTHLASRAQR
jgi:lysophospholipase L1-like esterase